MSAAARARLERVGIVLPPPPIPAARYLPWRVEGTTLYLAGVTSEPGGGPASDDGLAAARAAAVTAAARQLSSIEAAVGSLDAVRAVLRLTGYVACIPGFVRAPEVVDSASELFELALQDAGRHARSAIGVVALPGGATVELEAVVAVDPGSVPS